MIPTEQNQTIDVLCRLKPLNIPYFNKTVSWWKYTTETAVSPSCWPCLRQKTLFKMGHVLPPKLSPYKRLSIPVYDSRWFCILLLECKTKKSPLNRSETFLCDREMPNHLVHFLTDSLKWVFNARKWRSHYLSRKHNTYWAMCHERLSELGQRLPPCYLHLCLIKRPNLWFKKYRWQAFLSRYYGITTGVC